MVIETVTSSIELKPTFRFDLFLYKSKPFALLAVTSRLVI